MFQRWQYLLEKWHLLALLLLPLYYAYSTTADNLRSVVLLYGLYSIIVVASLWRLPLASPPAKITGWAWLEQFLFLALLLTLLGLFYLPQAPFSSFAAQVLWLNTQLAFAGLLLKHYWAVKTRQASAKTVNTAPHWLVGYASQSGVAQQLAQHNAAQLQQAGFAVTLAELNQINQLQLNSFQRALFVVSTYGDGEPPDNANQFYQLAQQWQHSLHQLQFAVLALGDSRYQQFCAFGRWLHTWLQQRDAKPLHPLLELDTAKQQAPVMTQWQQLLTGFTKTQAPQMQPIWQQARLESRYIANPASKGLPCFIVKLQLPKGSQWQAGDIVDIQPENSKCNVALWLTQHQINGCQAVQYKNQHMPLCWALAELQLDNVLPPPKGEPVDIWLAQQPTLPLRSYSIASLPEEGPAVLLVRQVKKPDDTLGIGSGWLTAWSIEQQLIQVRLREHTPFHLPPDDIPLILIASGTGIAGLRALLAQRVKRGQRQNWLIFGERHPDSDFFFAKDIRHWQQQGFIPQCDLAFSQAHANKYYVQHALAAKREQVKQWLASGAAIYVCGSLQGMGSAVHQVLTNIMGDAALSRLQQQGRYRRDLY
ncbi:sulfite reductase flavoprotein subunit alpha [Rheinheimera baltica]|uniref:sulfite reductase flavoprotein subunit alpha n=1 Tax=Rheinheimera baltica TaxID=67576 RepID=UPI00273D143F|nr:sulfite reductase flavoprotein subunit alpha [Rheinheimera baltica]MDP5188526.1 sulfite reductase flavoprotein subunit alpha [Rheinheimera baltica]